MICRNKKCQKEIPDESVFCLYCGAEQTVKQHRRTRSNGMGTAYKRGKTWTASVTVAWKEEERPEDSQEKEPHLIPIKRTKGGFKTKREALEYCAELRGQPAKVKHAGITFSKLYDQLIERHAERVGKSTLDCYKAAYKHFKPIYAIKVVDMTTEDMQNCVAACPYGKRTRENMKALGTLMFTLAIEKQLVTVNHAKNIWIPRLETESYNAFPNETRDKILEAALAGDNAAAIIACACYLGYRPSALLAIRKSDYDMTERTITGGSKTKAGKNLTIPINSKIQPLIDRLVQNPTEYIFVPGNSPINERTYREDYFYPCLARLGIQPIPKQGEKPTFSPYSCRHTFATSMKNVDGSQKDKAALMGHTSYEMTLKYQHEDLKSKREIIDQI